MRINCSLRDSFLVQENGYEVLLILSATMTPLRI